MGDLEKMQISSSNTADGKVVASVDVTPFQPENTSARNANRSHMTLSPKLGIWGATAIGNLCMSSWIVVAAGLVYALTGGGAVGLFWGFFC